jgi:hypothetical protein
VILSFDGFPFSPDAVEGPFRFELDSPPIGTGFGFGLSGARRGLT